MRACGVGCVAKSFDDSASYSPRGAPTSLTVSHVVIRLDVHPEAPGVSGLQCRGNNGKLSSGELESAGYVAPRQEPSGDVLSLVLHSGSARQGTPTPLGLAGADPTTWERDVERGWG